MADDNLPAEQSDFHPQALEGLPEETIYLPQGTSLTDAQKVDALVLARSFRGLSDAWSQAYSVSAICHLALATAKMIKERRDILGLPSAYKDTSLKSNNVWEMD